MDMRYLVDQLTPADRLPGVALLVARDAIESSVIDGAVNEVAAENLRRAADHLMANAVGSGILRSHPALVGQLIHIADTRILPTASELSAIRFALRELVRAVPAEGTVSVTADYAGF